MANLSSEPNLTSASATHDSSPHFIYFHHSRTSIFYGIISPLFGLAGQNCWRLCRSVKRKSSAWGQAPVLFSPLLKSSFWWSISYSWRGVTPSPFDGCIGNVRVSDLPSFEERCGLSSWLYSFRPRLLYFQSSQLVHEVSFSFS